MRRSKKYQFEYDNLTKLRFLEIECYYVFYQFHKGGLLDTLLIKTGVIDVTDRATIRDSIDLIRPKSSRERAYFANYKNISYNEMEKYHICNRKTYLKWMREGTVELMPSFLNNEDTIKAYEQILKKLKDLIYPIAFLTYLEEREEK